TGPPDRALRPGGHPGVARPVPRRRLRERRGGAGDRRRPAARPGRLELADRRAGVLRRGAPGAQRDRHPRDHRGVRRQGRRAGQHRTGAARLVVPGGRRPVRPHGGMVRAALRGLRPAPGRCRRHHRPQGSRQRLTTVFAAVTEGAGHRRAPRSAYRSAVANVLDSTTDTPEPDDGRPGEAPLLRAPREGLPPVVTDAAGLASTVGAFRAGSGPVAVDAERASGYRYGQRAYLVQLRRTGAGSALIDPVACPDLSGLSEALSGAEMVLHAA